MTTPEIKQAIDDLARASFAEGQADSPEKRFHAHEHMLECRKALERTLASVQEVQVAALREAQSVLGSINQGSHHAVKVNDEVCYWQRKEWIDWAVKEVLPQVSAAMGGLPHTCGPDV